MYREKCVICGDENLSVFLRYQMPVYSSDVEKVVDYEIDDIIFCECENCNAVQLEKIIDPLKVYKWNHNREVVGKTWENHYQSFRDFINDVEGKTVLEISDPVAKVATKFNDFERWFIVEPHAKLNLETNRIFFIDKFFDDSFEFDDKVDIIIHSHFFEHTFEPSKFLKKCHTLLKDDGVMYMSIPNLQNILDSGFNPNSILHIEHTFYYDNDILNFLAETTEFTICDVQNFEGHSIFVKLIKQNTEKKISRRFEKSSTKFLDNYQKYKNLIAEINNLEENIILFGCHISSQFLIYNGLNTEKIDFIIDNSLSKQDKYLYGTKLLTKSPNVVLDCNLPIVVSHMGIYSKEIKEGLLKIKNDLNLI